MDPDSEQTPRPPPEPSRQPSLQPQRPLQPLQPRPHSAQQGTQQGTQQDAQQDARQATQQATQTTLQQRAPREGIEGRAPVDLPPMPDFSRYALIIDARSPHEYEEDHVPGAVSLPVVDDGQYAVVGTLHKDDRHRAYLIGVEHSLRNMADAIASFISRFGRDDRILVYCFRGGKRSRLWAETLRIIGFRVDVLPGGWKSYRRWVRSELEQRPLQLDLRVLIGSTGVGKTRLLAAINQVGGQVLDLEALASHSGSLIGAVPGRPQPSQKLFDSMLNRRIAELDPSRPVWVEAESKKIGALQLPESLYETIHRARGLVVEAPMAERVRLWREDYAHWVEDPEQMVSRLQSLKPLIGGEELDCWRELAGRGEVDALFERVMRNHYDLAYGRTTRRHWPGVDALERLNLPSLSAEALRQVARQLLEVERDDRPFSVRCQQDRPTSK